MADLPQPNEAFDWVQGAFAPALVCRPLARVAQHLYTTRLWTLGRTAASDQPGQWNEIARAIDLDPADLVGVRQVHGASVLVVPPDGRHPREPPDADIIVSRASGIALVVRAADCVPLLVADPRSGAVAAAHAGWRGLAARVPAETVAALAREFGSRPSDLLAAIGPSIGACCYEVGVDVKERFESEQFGASQIGRWFSAEPSPSSRNPSTPGVLSPRRPDHWFFDSWSAARDGLVEAGIPPIQVFVAELCTASHPHAFCSYRRDGAPAGRMAGVIRRLPPDP